MPGWGTTINTYITLIQSISLYANVLCLDMPGFGESSEPNKSWNTDDFVKFIIKFIERQGIKELDLIGHSNGGRIIIKLLNRKDLSFKVNKVVLIGSAGIVHKKKLSQKIVVKMFKIGKKVLNLKLIKNVFPQALTNFKNKFGSEDYKKASPIMRETLVKLVNEDLKELLPNIKVPTLLVWGENDTATPVSDGELMKKLIPDAGLIKVKDCTHYVFLERVDYINRILKTFLREKIDE